MEKIEGVAATPMAVTQQAVEFPKMESVCEPFIRRRAATNGHPAARVFEIRAYHENASTE